MNRKSLLSGLITTSLLFASLSANSAIADNHLEAKKNELIVLSAPITGDTYYEEQADNIFDFHVNYAKKIISNGDEVKVLVDDGAYAKYVKALGKEHVEVYPMLDIWMRDFGTSNVENAAMFRYTAAGQGGGKSGQRKADEVQEEYAELIDGAGLAFIETDLLNDGGNLVDDYAGNAVISRKFLRDNKLTEDQARQALQKLLGLKHVAFIESDEQGGLEHSDGVVAFVAENTLIINSYSEDPEYAEQLKADLRRGLPNVKIHEIVTPYDASHIYDEKFGSACGLYTNALVTPDTVYLPQFGIPEDSIALATVQGITNRKVVPVSSAGICAMGGGVRCMSTQLRGVNKQAFLDYFSRD
ncbi:agmatine deiminase family protein [Photobacterium swingsii]|uniref:agmatine deiminase family protein n=1 Tax=Photobacterium swingsii TaxID=680026 RepID=UPI00352FD703